MGIPCADGQGHRLAVHVYSSVVGSYQPSPMDIGALDKKNMDCRFCGKKGHLEKECWKKHGKPQGGGGKSGGKGGRGKGGGKGGGGSPTKGACFKCGKVGHKAWECRGGRRQTNNI